MDTMLHIYINIACMAMSCMALPAGPVFIWLTWLRYHQR